MRNKRFKSLIRRLLLWVGVITLVPSSSCLGHHKKGPGAKPPAKKAPALIGYCNPWTWSEINPDSFAKQLYEAGLTATLIEVDADKDAQFVGRWVAPFRKLGITVEIIAVNWNSEEILGKPDSWYFNLIDGLIKYAGYDHTILQPVSEPGNRGGDKAKCIRWQRYAYEHWKGQTIVSGTFDWAKEFRGHGRMPEKHWCSEPNGNMIQGWNNSTDCGPQLSMDERRVRQATRSACDKKINFMLYDGYAHQPDQSRIRWMKEEVQK